MYQPYVCKKVWNQRSYFMVISQASSACSSVMIKVHRNIAEIRVLSSNPLVYTRLIHNPYDIEI